MMKFSTPIKTAPLALAALLVLACGIGQHSLVAHRSNPSLSYSLPRFDDPPGGGFNRFAAELGRYVESDPLAQVAPTPTGSAVHGLLPFTQSDLETRLIESGVNPVAATLQAQQQYIQMQNAALIGEQAQIHAASTYSYANNDPVRSADPTGLDAFLFIPGTPGVMPPPQNLPLYPLPGPEPLSSWWYNSTPLQRFYGCSFGLGSLCLPIAAAATPGWTIPVGLGCRAITTGICSAACLP